MWYLLELSSRREKRELTKKKFNKERNGRRKHIFICIDPLSSCFLLTFLFQIKKNENRTSSVNGILRRTKRETEREKEKGRVKVALALTLIHQLLYFCSSFDCNSVFTLASTTVILNHHIYIYVYLYTMTTNRNIYI